MYVYFSSCAASSISYKDMVSSVFDRLYDLVTRFMMTLTVRNAMDSSRCRALNLKSYLRC